MSELIPGDLPDAIKPQWDKALKDQRQHICADGDLRSGFYCVEDLLNNLDKDESHKDLDFYEAGGGSDQIKDLARLGSFVKAMQSGCFIGREYSKPHLAQAEWDFCCINDGRYISLGKGATAIEAFQDAIAKGNIKAPF